MIGRSVVTRLWIAIVALFAVMLAILFSSVSTVVTNFYVQTKVNDLVGHGDEIIRRVQSGQSGAESEALIDLVAAMSNATVMIVGPDGEMLVCSGDMPASDPVHIRTMKDVTSALAGTRSSSVVKDPFSNAPALSLAMPLRMADKPAALVFLAPAGPIQQTIEAVVRVLLVISVCGIIVITVLAFFLSRRLSRPLLHMATAASEMAAGDFSRRIETFTDDEVGQLGRSMNHMSAQLEQTLSTLAAERDRLEAVLARERHLVEAQKEFVANVSHELRTPLSYLQGYTEAILDGLAGPEDEQRYLRIILDECQRLRRLVSDLLDLTVIESGQAPLRPERFPVNGPISEVAQSLRPIADAKGVVIAEPAGAAVAEVLADPDRTKQVLVNLIDNAIRYSPAGGEVTVSVSGPDAARQVWIAVRDRGPGIPAELLPHVWERFFKADRARRRDSSGTGLGLAIARRLVEAQGGQVRVESTVGEGTVFSFSLPAA
ncbi:MAG: ATP-binding protein [Chloroflexota bacterium]